MRICDFDGARYIGKPKDWVNELDGHCAALPVVDVHDPLINTNVMYSFYQPTPEDLKALNAGGALRLGVLGNAHPVLRMCAVEADLCDAINIVPMDDLGPPVGLKDAA